MFVFFLVIDSFNEYIKAETLEGDNKYDAGEHGLQVSVTNKEDTNDIARKKGNLFFIMIWSFFKMLLFKLKLTLSGMAWLIEKFMSDVVELKLEEMPFSLNDFLLLFLLLLFFIVFHYYIVNFRKNCYF